ncbi:hypothetical protein HMJ29_02120 [Hymenobacter taeanensis]|uniref:Tetratricopeptide repeat protein n=1 Tax=Hymenobacter taeanensis TaxID=2735321 RepID=A0A6M6BEY9_9BACT|nr:MULTISPECIES: hypothetical protein [Hymenobacter]QJX45793.1 hypothetical protein HMJ29_02120 [Hymenobacter taeanensis]UOQ79636.1 hypothetical protein MUN83_12330 [Hymenobacter sp. 5414T-23]
MLLPSASSPGRWRGPLLLLAILTVLALGLSGWYAATGNDTVLPLRPVAQLTPVPTTVASVRIGLAELPVQANGYLLTQTYSVDGPYVQPTAALLLVGLLGAALAYFLATVSFLARPAFVVGMGLVIFLLMSLNADLLGVFNAREQYFLILSLVLLGGTSFAFHAFWPAVGFTRRLLLLGALVTFLGALLFLRSQYTPDVTALHLTAFFTAAGAVIFALVVVWVAYENIHGLLWLNTQAETPSGRFGLLPFLLTSLLYLGTLLLYYWNEGNLLILPGWHFDPLVLLVPAVVIGWLSLQQRSATYGSWVPFGLGANYLYLVFVLLAATALGYAFATANDPFLFAARDFTAVALLSLGTAFLLYVLVNFGPLLRKRMAVHRVVYAPRRFPFFAMYLLGLAALGAVELRNNFYLIDQVKAAYYNNLGDLTRLQSELAPGTDALALLAERYYAESDELDQHNHKASLGRAALYHFRLQRQNEINILRRALSRRPSEKISLRLAALYNEPADFFDRLEILRAGLKSTPRSAPLASDLAQLFTRSSLSDSVAYYQTRAEALAPNNPVLRSNRLAYLIQQQQWPAAQQLATESADASSPALQSNRLLLGQLTNQRPENVPAPQSLAEPLSPASFAHLYHYALGQATQRDTALLPTFTQLAAQPENAPYADQLTFLRALTQQYGGQSVAAQATLRPLASGTGPAAAYYQLVQGLWLLDQRLYAAAAPRLAEAVQNGTLAAGLPHAYALALSGQLDSARRVATYLLKQPQVPFSALTQEVFTIAQPDFGTEYTQASDSLKAQYLVLRGDEFPAGADLLAPAIALQQPAPRQAALLAQLPRAFRAGQLASARQVLQRYAPAVTTRSAEASAWNVQRGELLVRTKQWSALEQLTKQAYLQGPDQAWRRYFQAVLAEANKQPQQAAKLYAQLVVETPFVESGILAAAQFYMQRKEYTTAYNTLLKGIDYNPESAELLKAYVLAAIPVGLNEYAATPLEHLAALLSPQEYSTFRTQVEAQRTAQAASNAPWD